MIRRSALLIVLFFALAALGCYSAPVMPPNGFIFTNIEAPVSPAVSGQEFGARTGESSSVAILGLVAWGDASVDSAVQNGGITSPRHIDYKYFNVLGLYQRFTTVVRGD